MAQRNRKVNDSLNHWALSGLHIVFGEWLCFQHLTHSVFYCSLLGALKINLKERTAGKSYKGNSKGMNLSFRTDLSSNRAVPIWGKDRHPHCKARSAKNQPLLQVQVGGRRRSVRSHSSCTSLLAQGMWPSFTLSTWVHLQASGKCLPALISNLIACIDFSYCQKVWAIHLYLFIHLFSRKLMVSERLSTNCAW